jgi:hypothetical protein
MSPDPSAGEVGAVVGALGLIGGTVAWLFGRRDRSEDRFERDESTREAKLAAWHDELLAREQLVVAQQTAFQARVDRHMAEQDDKIAVLEREIEKYRVAVPLLAARVAQNDPADPVLAQVSKLLGSTFAISATTPPDMLTQLKDIP